MLIVCTRCAQPTKNRQVGPHARPVRSGPQASSHSGRAGPKAHYHGPNYMKGVPYELGFHQAATGHIVHRCPHPPRLLSTHDSPPMLPRQSLRGTVHRWAVQATVTMDASSSGTGLVPRLHDSGGAHPHPLRLLPTRDPPPTLPRPSL
jgi:hypothetical protein